MRKAVLALISATMLGSSNAFAQDLSGAGDLLYMCENRNEKWQQTSCLAYFVGVKEGILMGVVLSGADSSVLPFCFPDTISNGTALSSFLDYMRSGAGKPDMPSPVAIAIAFQTAFPCR